jgi:hypothetical protein
MRHARFFRFFIVRLAFFFVFAPNKNRDPKAATVASFRFVIPSDLSS